MSIFGISIRPFLSARSYYAFLYYVQKDIYSWHVDFVILLNLRQNIAAVHSRYSSLDSISGPRFQVQFESDIISLAIPEDGICLENGWTITPLVPPVIEKQQVDRFKPGQCVPYCRLQVKLDKDKKPIELQHKVKLHGAKSPYNFFTITFPPEEPALTHLSGMTERTPSKPQLKDLMDALYHKVADKWRMIGLYLEIPKGKLAGIAKKCRDDPHSCLVAMLETWLERVNPPATWTAIIEAVEFLGEEQLGKELREKYYGETSTTQFGAADGKRMQLEGMIMSDEEAQAIVDQALKSGSIKQRNTVAIIVGIVGSGKTWLIHRLFRISPPARYTSTGVAEKSIRGLMHRIANMDSWKLLSQEDILEFLAPLLKAGLTKADIVSLAKTFTEVGAPQPSAEAFIEIEELQPDADDIPSPTHSHATVAQSEKSYASQAMTRLVKTVKGPNEAFVVEFLHMIDTGGQPEFIEIMPSLIHNSNFTLLVLNLAQSLDECPPIDYHEDGRAFRRPLPSVLTNRQVIHQYARTLQAKRPTHTGTSHPSIFTVIGTHRDCVKGKLTETLAAVNKELKSIFLPAMEDELIVYRSHDEIIFPVNLLEPDDNDKIVLEQIRQKISDAHIVEKAEVPLIPFSFFMFEQNAIKYAEQKKAEDRQVMVLSFDECVQIGTELKMNHDVVRAALIYFHRHNIFLYFQDVLPNLVFLAPQVPLDFVNAIVAFSYKVKSGALPALKAKFVRFCNEGIITEEMLCDHKSLSSCFVPGIYESQHAITLFRHIYTIAELTNEEPLATSQHLVTHSSRLEQKSSTRSREYLMMSLLADKKDIVDYLPSPSKVAPLVIHFSCGCVPNGCFGNVISCLISKNNWKVCQTEEGKPACLAHNVVTLRDPMLPVTITIVNHVQHLEIHVNMAKVEEHFSEICLSIKTTTFSVLKNVFKVMRFEDIQVEPAFLCPCKCSPSHAATVCHFLYGGSYTVCTKTGISIGCLQKEQQFWFQEKKGSQLPNLELKDLMHLHISNWYRLGLALGLKSYKLDIIKRDHQGDTESQICKMFEHWLKTQPDASYEQLIKALCEVGDETVANSLCNKYGVSLPLDPAAKIDARSQVHQSTITGGKMPYANCGTEIQPPQLGLGAAHGAVHLRSRSSAKKRLRSHSPRHSGSSRSLSMSQSSSATTPSHCAKAMVTIFIMICIVLLCMLIQLLY